MRRTTDLHVVDARPLLSPANILAELPLEDASAELVAATRGRIRAILTGADRRLLVVVGPCSIHDTRAALEYATRLAPLRAALKDRLEIVMRVYFEKPRTTTGWKGFLNDPHLDGSFDINTGLRLARTLLLDLARAGMPAATELLDPITPQYLADLVTWTAIGARTTESQTHREMASGLSMPVGFKNGTDGTLATAINALLSARTAHHFLGINTSGQVAIIATTGNPDGHAVLRGGKHGPNFGAAAVAEAAAELARRGVAPRVMIDCSHDNAQKDPARQPVVLADIARQVAGGSPHIIGVMIESHLLSGRQEIPADLAKLVYGRSITDACVDFATTESMLRGLSEAVAESRLQPN